MGQLINDMKIRAAALILVVASMISGVGIWGYSWMHRIENNTVQIEHTQQLHNKDIEFLKIYHAIEEATCEERRGVQNDRIDRLERECEKVEEKINDTQ